MAIAKSPLQYKGVRAIQPPDLVKAKRAPTGTDKAYLPGQLWLDTANNASYQWSGTEWISLGSGSTGAIDTLTGDSGGAIVPVGGNITLAGTAAAGISTTGSAGTITFNIAAATTSQRGTLATSTNAQSVTGTDATVAVTPASLTARLAAPGTIGGTTPGAGAFTTLTSTGVTTIGSGAGVAVAVGNATGTLGFFGSGGATKVTQGAITNSVTAGGSTGTIANYTDLSVYANDATAIRNDIYQLSLALANVVGALRSYGLLV